MRTVRDAKFVPQWVDLTQEYPAPFFGHITRQYLNLSYGGHPLQAVDLYLPEEGKPPFPTLILVHGGGFSRCDKRDLSVYPGFYALREGFALASVNYRLVPEYRFPCQIYDVKAAIRFLKGHAGEYGLDPRSFFLYGDSAGGYLVSMVGATQHGSSLDGGAAGPEGESCAVRGVAAIAPLINLVRHYGQLERVDYLSPDLHKAMLEESSAILADYLGTPKGRLGALAEKASVDTYLTSAAPPFYIQHGTRDTIIPPIQAIDFAGRLRGLIGGEKVVLDLIEGAKHVGTSPEFIEEEHVLPILRFFRTLL